LGLGLGLRLKLALSEIYVTLMNTKN